jgi:dipeptidyl aminopeptidase/acylaminoacyl peptidase
MKLRITALLALACLAAAAPPPVAAEPQPVRDFVSHGTYGDARISPDGTYLAVTVDRGEQDVLTILRTSDLEIIKVNQLPDDKSVGRFAWISNERLVFNAIRKLGGYAQPFNTGEWYAVNADGSQARPLVFYGTLDATQRSKTVGNQVFDLLDTLDDDDRYIVMEVMSPRSSEGAGTEAVRVDTFTGRRTSLGRAPKENCSIVLGADKTPGFAVCSSSRGDSGEYVERTELYRYEDGKWALVSTSRDDDRHLAVMHTAPNGTIYATQEADGAPAAIGTLDRATGEFTPLFQDPVAEATRITWSIDDNAIVAVRTEAGAPKVTIVEGDHPDAQLYESLAAAFPGQVVDFSSHTKDGRRIVVSVGSDRNAGELYLYDRDSGQARFLMHRRPALEAGRMATVRPFAFTARDGRQIHAFLTIPHGSDGRNLPLIVNPHGGPIGPRDDWGFNPEAQLFASRGYAVLQVNYRGSGGYGRAFRDAGHLEWGQGIQNDIIDATNWVIDNGHADRQRICIYGGSFGGYSSLMAPIRAPGLFKCAFGYVGVYDIAMMFEKGDIPSTESGQRYLRRTHGTDREVWAANSPASRAAEVRIPVYLAAGARDVRTPPEQTERMERALRDAGNPPEGMIIQSGEMHGFYDVENRVKLYTTMLDFFARHIGTPTSGTVTAD